MVKCKLTIIFPKSNLEIPDLFISGSENGLSEAKKKAYFLQVEIKHAINAGNGITITDATGIYSIYIPYKMLKKTSFVFDIQDEEL